MIDAGAVLDQVPGHVDVIVDDGFQQGGPQVFVFGVHISSGLRTKLKLHDEEMFTRPRV